MYLIYQIPILIFSVILHEYAHGWMAERRGDDTARIMGRLTFNPIPHLDFFGSILLPLFLILSGAPFLFAWAKPVPVNPYRLNDPTRDMKFVSVAGPLSNILLAVLCAFVIYVLDFVGMSDMILHQFLLYAVVINVLLPIFNLVPIPPLDGSRVVAAILPPSLSHEYMKLEPYGIFIIMFLMATGTLWRLLMPIVNFIVRNLIGAPFYV